MIWSRSVRLSLMERCKYGFLDGSLEAGGGKEVACLVVSSSRARSMAPKYN